MKIYTKTGDDGSTALYRGGRVMKDSLRVSAYGTVDELNSHIGYLLTLGVPLEVEKVLHRVQNDLFVIGADLATPRNAVNPKEKGILRLSTSACSYLEDAIDAMDAELEPLTRFILPGGSTGGAYAHVLRTVCRRAERECVSLHREEEGGTAIVTYLNRLSDYCFVLARYLNRTAGRPDTPWIAS